MATVLIVEDEESIARSLAELLQDAGFEALREPDGQAAMDRLVDGLRPDVILLDLVMPRMDGYRFRHLQVRTPSIADIPVIVHSANYYPNRLFADCIVLQKPCPFAIILDAVTRTIAP
jgi:CheY-like chemotaxis protein